MKLSSIKVSSMYKLFNSFLTLLSHRVVCCIEGFFSSISIYFQVTAILYVVKKQKNDTVQLSFNFYSLIWTFSYSSEERC